MNDLTEQWKKGELPEGVYYCNTGNTVETLFTWGKNYHQLTNNKDEVYIPEMDDCEIIAPVPNYDEWKANQKWIKHLEDVIKVYERKDKQATETSVAYNELEEENKELKEILERHKKATAKAQIRSCDLEIINAQLKELLKECFEYIDWTDGTGSPISQQKLLDKIDEALK